MNFFYHRTLKNLFPAHNSHLGRTSDKKLWDQRKLDKAFKANHTHTNTHDIYVLETMQKSFTICSLVKHAYEPESITSSKSRLPTLVFFTHSCNFSKFENFKRTHLISSHCKITQFSTSPVTHKIDRLVTIYGRLQGMNSH